MNVLTAIVILIFVIAGLRGYQKGFVKSLASLVSVLLSFVLVNLVNPYVTDFLKEHTPAFTYIEDKCADAFSVAMTGSAATEAGASLLQDEAIDSLPLPETLKNMLRQSNTSEYYAKQAVRSFSEYVPKFMANLILTIISFVITWILVIVFLWLAVKALDLMAHLPVIKGINQALGIFVGVFQGLVIVWLVFMVITVFSHTDTGRQLMAMISENPFLETLYNTNILLNFLTGFLGSFA